MKLSSHAKSAFNNLLFSPLKTLLAMVGIMVGTASVVALISSGNLAAEKSLELFKSLGTNLMTINFSPTDWKNASKNPIRLAPLLAMKDHIPSILRLAPYATTNLSAAFQNISWNVNVVGSTEDLDDISHINMQQGRFLQALDQDQSYCVIGQEVYKKLQTTNPIGQRIRLGLKIFTIIGVALPWQQNNFFNADIDSSVMITLNSMKLVSKDALNIHDALIQLRDNANIDFVKQQIVKYFADNFPLYQVNTSTAKELIKKMNDQQSTFTLLLSFIGAISLLVGGIGVMNIMLASVAERRYEIGLRLALGAQPKDIQTMFIMEAIILAVIGGGIGVIFGILCSYLVALVSGWTFYVYFMPPLVGFSFSVLISIFFGFYPAYVASHLNPIQALRAS